MKIIVVDLDGTLADTRARDHFAQNKEWDEFHKRIPEDPPHKDVLTLLQMLIECGNGPYIIGCTGRPEKERIATDRWLITHRAPIDELLMRPEFDYRPDVEVKPELLRDWHQNSREECRSKTLQELVLFVLEDREKMVDAWRSIGLNCWHVRQGAW